MPGCRVSFGEDSSQNQPKPVVNDLQTKETKVLKKEKTRRKKKRRRGQKRKRKTQRNRQRLFFSLFNLKGFYLPLVN